MKRRILNMLIGLDQFVYVLVTLGAGHPDMTISGASYKYGVIRCKRWVRYCMYFIDWLFSPLEDDHCKKAYYNESEKVRNY